MSHKSPSFRQNRVEWNKVWEKELDAIYGTSQEIRIRPGLQPESIVDGLPSVVYERVASGPSVQVFHQLKRQLCTLQRDLSNKVVKRYAEDNFEEAWKKCTTEEREKWMLEGLCRTCSASPDFEDHRRLAPETKLARNNFQSGQGFLDLIDKLILQDIETIPEDYRTVPNVIFDALNGLTKKKDGKQNSRGRQFLQDMNDCNRTTFLTFFVWTTLLAFYGESEDYGLMKTSERGQDSNYEALKNHARETGDQKLLNQIKKAKAEAHANQALGVRVCTSCGLNAERAGVPNLQACQRCKSVSRHVYYCSKACQIQDWKTGHPPHKTICGNKDAYADPVLGSGAAASNADGKDKSKAPDIPADEDSWPGKVQPGFTRSPALLHQLKLLKENPSFDYLLVRPYPHPDQGIVFQDSMGGLFFKVSMKRAACGPAPREVLMMYQMLEPFASRVPGYGKAGLKKQMQKEYGVDIDALSAMAAQEKAAQK